MKKIITITFLSLTTVVNAQIKVFPGGLQSYGSTTAPTGSVKNRFSGDVVVGQLPSSTEAAYIRGNNTTSTAANPDYTWLSNTNTGMFHPASNTIGFVTNGVERARINANGQIVSSATSGSASIPDFSWNVESGTGMYRPASNRIGFTIASAEKMRLGAYSLLLGSTTDDVGKIAITGDLNRLAIQSWSNYNWNGGIHEQVNVNRDATHAYMLYNTSTGTAVLKFEIGGNGDVWEKSAIIWSDRNLKENIDTLQNSLSKIKQLKGVKYNFKASFIGNGPIKTEIGLIAQDVEKVIPEAVSANMNGIKGIAYHNIIPVLIEAIKELDAKNSKLENDLNACCSKSNGGKTNRVINSSSDNNELEEAKSYMKQNKPNPFNKESVIEYNIVESGSASILVFDMNGKLLKTILVKTPGKGNITISANDFQPGMYYYSLIINETEIDTKKMILTQ